MAEDTNDRLEGLYDAVEAANMKTFTEAGTRVQAMFEAAMANQLVRAASLATAHDNRVGVLAETALGKMLNGQTAGPIEAATAVSKINSSDVPALLAQLMAVVSAGQQQAKVAQTTPPETAQ